MKPKQVTRFPLAVRSTARIFFCLVLFAGAFSLPSAVKAQLKIGDNPTQITPSAILELNSTEQGFLLPRLNNWQIDATFSGNIPDGMMIFYDATTSDSTGIYIRKDNAWQKVTTSEQANTLWSRTGNTITDGADTLGSLNSVDLKIITNNTQRIRIDGATGLVHFTTDSVTVAGRLHTGGRVFMDSSLTVSDTVYADGLQTQGRAVIEGDLVLPNTVGQSLFTEVLVVDTATGVVSRRTIDPDVFKGWTIGNFNETGTAQGLELKASANGTDKDTLILHAATVTTPGGVSVAAQTFGGNKTFQDSLTAQTSLLVGTSGTAARATLQVEGSVALKVSPVTVNYTIADNDYTILAAANNIEITLPVPDATNEGRIYIVKKTAATNFAQPVKLKGNIEGNGTADMGIYNQGTSLKLQSTGATGTWLIIDRM